jgi:hypothetical protein
MCDAVLSVDIRSGIYTLGKQVMKGCLTCKKVSKQSFRKQPLGRRAPGIRPFKSIQIDYTELPQVGRLKYVLVVVVT